VAIPDYQTVMLPLLRFAGDRQEHSLRETIDALADTFGLTPDERKELLPSGQQEVFDNRVGWARTYLTKAALLQKTRRSHYEISLRGLEVLAASPDRVDVKFLDQFDEFREFRALKGTRSGSGLETEVATVDQQATPEEALEQAYGSLRDSLAADILQQVKSFSPSLFEKLVVELLVKMVSTSSTSKRSAGRPLLGGLRSRSSPARCRASAPRKAS
jgi:restriction system protein